MACHKPLTPWTLDPTRAVEIQRELAAQVRVEPLNREVKLVAGGDISFDRGSDTVHAGFVVLRLPDLQIVERKGIQATAAFPYVPGLLSFREIPALLQAWSLLELEPDAVIIDGHGMAHPRRVGIASHFGLLVDRPTVGCAKSVLVGQYQEPDGLRGSWTPLTQKGEEIGAALRTRDRVGPVFASVGHRIDIPGAVALILASGGRMRIPEPTRLAHNYVNELRRNSSQPSLGID